MRPIVTDVPRSVSVSVCLLVTIMSCAKTAEPNQARCRARLSNFTDLCLETDQNLFRKVLHNPEHVLSTYSRQFQPLYTVLTLGHAHTTENSPNRLPHLV